MSKVKEEKFNGKPMSYWNRKADELVIDCLVRAAHNLDTRSVIGKQASDRLTHLAMAVSPELYAQCMEQIEVMTRNLATILNSCIAPETPKSRKKKEKR